MHSVLVVDDEPFVRLSLASLKNWQQEGFDFHFEAGNGAEALAVLADHPEIDILLLDISMPVLDGIELLRRLASGELRRETGLPAVIVLSAYDEYHLVRTAFTLGARDYLLKSELEGEALLAMLKKTAEGIEHSRERSSTILERTQLRGPPRPGAPRPAPPAPRPRRRGGFRGPGPVPQPRPSIPARCGSGISRRWPGASTAKDCPASPRWSSAPWRRFSPAGAAERW